MAGDLNTCVCVFFWAIFLGKLFNLELVENEPFLLEALRRVDFNVFHDVASSNGTTNRNMTRPKSE